MTSIDDFKRTLRSWFTLVELPEHLQDRLFSKIENERFDGGECFHLGIVESEDEEEEAGADAEAERSMQSAPSELGSSRDARVARAVRSNKSSVHRNLDLLETEAPPENVFASPQVCTPRRGPSLASPRLRRVATSVQSFASEEGHWPGNSPHHHRNARGAAATPAAEGAAKRGEPNTATPAAPPPPPPPQLTHGGYVLLASKDIAPFEDVFLIEHCLTFVEDHRSSHPLADMVETYATDPLALCERLEHLVGVSPPSLPPPAEEKRDGAGAKEDAEAVRRRVEEVEAHMAPFVWTYRILPLGTTHVCYQCLRREEQQQQRQQELRTARASASGSSTPYYYDGASPVDESLIDLIGVHCAILDEVGSAVTVLESFAAPTAPVRMRRGADGTAAVGGRDDNAAATAAAASGFFNGIRVEANVRLATVPLFLPRTKMVLSVMWPIRAIPAGSIVCRAADPDGWRMGEPQSGGELLAVRFGPVPEGHRHMNG